MAGQADDRNAEGAGASGDAPNRAKRQATLLPQAALDAADSEIARVADVLTTAANAIEGLLDNKALPLNNTIRDFVTSSTGKIRGLAERATAKEAADLMIALQRAAANHPAATASIGATIGAALGVALVALGVRNNKAAPEDPGAA